MNLFKKSIWISIKEYALITLGVLMYVTGWIIFLIPNNMIGGGVTGLGSIVQYATGGAIKIGYTYFVVNAGLLIAALFTLGRSFGAKSIYAILLTSVALNVGQDIFPQQIIQLFLLGWMRLKREVVWKVQVISWASWAGKRPLFPHLPPS